jgi:preprotein translocase subunit Sec61beta
MDIALYVRVLRRHRRVVGAGFVFAILVTALAVVRVDPASGTISRRGQEQWVSYSRVFVTQPGFPYGELRTRGKDPATLAANAVFYSNLAMTDAVLKSAFGAAGPGGQVEAAPVLASSFSNDALPIISIAGIGPSAGAAERIARLETQGLISYVESQQADAKISPNNRVVLQVINRPHAAVLRQARSTTVPVVVFLTLMMAVIGVAFLLENVRPAIRAVGPGGVAVAEAEPET